MKKRIKEACNIQFIKDLFYVCSGFNVLDDDSDIEIEKRTKIEDDSIFIRLTEEETKCKKPVEFRYKKQADGCYEYLGFRICE